MNKAKKILTTITTVALITVLMFALTAAASANTPAEQIEARLSEIASQHSGPIVQQARAQATVWLSQYGYTVTAAQAAAVLEQINAAVATAGGATAFADLSQGEINSIMGNLANAAYALNLSADFVVDATGLRARITDAGGRVVAYVAQDPIRQTGIDHSAIIAITLGISALFGVAAIAAVASRKKKLTIKASV